MIDIPTILKIMISRRIFKKSQLVLNFKSRPSPFFTPQIRPRHMTGDKQDAEKDMVWQDVYIGKQS